MIINKWSKVSKSPPETIAYMYSVDCECDLPVIKCYHLYLDPLSREDWIIKFVTTTISLVLEEVLTRNSKLLILFALSHVVIT